MRTTLTLDADVARTLKAAVRRRNVTFKEAVNTALRCGLGLESRPRSKTAFVVHAHSGGHKPGIDPRKLNKLLSDLEDQSDLAAVRRK